MKKWAILLVAAVMAFTMAACSGNNEEGDGNSETEQVLKIAYFNGGYGDEWLKGWVAAFEAAHPGVKVEIEGDPGITEKMGPRLESGANLPDLAFVLRTNWQRWGIMGYLADLTDVYESTIDNGKTFKEKLQPGAADYGLIRDKYWVAPWTDGATGFVYNAGMFEEHGWKVPETMAELEQLLPSIKEKGIAPFAWGGKVMAYWDFPTVGWWAQYEGAEGVEAYKEMASPDVYGQEGRLKALEQFYELLADPSNSISGAEGMDHIQSQMAFVQGKAAIIPNGAWLENEMRTSLPEGFRMKMMQLPAIDGAKDAKVNNTQGGDFAIIPAKAKNVELAKEFLKFTASDDMLKLFTEKTGSVRPFVYDAASVSGLSEFSQSVIDIWQNSRNVYLFSQNPIYYSKYYDWPLAGAPYMMIYMEDETPESAFQGNLQFAKENWEKTKADLGIE
ncbi:ABC carbohydrate transporter substrate-binding [Paenibacillus agaridevorans]|jgi:N-acetylglucosamine transport system substrate-binding protein|uniref:ABC carbohydrate transporter substrate-binding n=1 Tax=Paenibacillus agaridevorans TaxID=171404 RepID=A0A2R5F053_9BACL|nr:extracellular solute-binding protein [Paenibacillus agaridevorans]GBG11289.1 ABC carbohydrate transporter substrate-binding [Paenibacillus agaridevorans]